MFHLIPGHPFGQPLSLSSKVSVFFSLAKCSLGKKDFFPFIEICFYDIFTVKFFMFFLFQVHCLHFSLQRSITPSFFLKKNIDKHVSYINLYPINYKLPDFYPFTLNPPRWSTTQVKVASLPSVTVTFSIGSKNSGSRHRTGMWHDNITQKCDTSLYLVKNNVIYIYLVTCS